MYAVSGKSPEGETTYWVGGESFIAHPQGAARFVKEVDADATILLLTRALPQLGDLHITELPEDRCA